MSTLKPGDWVVVNNSIENIIKVEYEDYEEDGIETRIFIDHSEECNGAEDVEIWKPKPGEWCWFWNKYMDIDQSPKLAQFNLMVEELQEPMDFPAFYQTKYKTIKLGYLYDFCEPYIIGRLPSVLKDNK